MKIMVKIEIIAKPENTKKVELFFKRILPETRNYTGCESAKISRFVKEPYKFILIEHWESSQHYLDYGEWRNRTGDFEMLRTMLFTGIDLQVLEVLIDY